ncbi:hypothetical protein Csa_018021 [Cucumis sativus]|uniref:Uncharacterized protein n=1 Tax=Cucumis sativus TaxID=3659 RepID=A0A0A0KWU6_CUCSA|nr:hypothetical protein Csa_018021 [Cucumis sativus]
MGEIRMEFSRGKYAMTADCRLHYFFALEEMKFNEIINVPQKYLLIQLITFVSICLGPIEFDFS